VNLTVLEQVERTSARTEKERLLATLGVDTQRFLQLVADPFCTFGHTVDEARLERLQDQRTREETPERVTVFWNALYSLAGDLAERRLTGHAAEEAVDTLLCNAPSDTCLIWGARIINQDLRLGVATATILKVFPGLIEPFQVQLAHPYEPGKHTIEGRWSAEPKLDGLRMIVLDGKAYTRNGKGITSADHILEQLASVVDLSQYVFDGECMGQPGTEFNTISGKVRKGGACPELIYHVFDCVRRGEWASKKTQPFAARRLDLEEVLWDSKPNVQVVPNLTLPKNPSAADIFSIRDQFMESGFEGTMLKNMAAPYYFKRTADLLKVKGFVDADGPILGTFEGKGKYKGMLGGLEVEFDGVMTQVGSGFTDAMRKDLWARRNEILGHHVEVRYQNKTPDGCLRFPVFVQFRPDKD
jgi:DNA ligase-1